MLSDLERQWWNDQVEPPAQTTSGEAIAALVFGICGICVLPVIGPLVAVAGIALGWIGIALAAFWIYVLFSFSPG